MRVLLSASVLGIALSLSSGCAAAHAAQLANGQIELASSFTIDASTEIPGKTLKAGKYTITVLDHLADRAILQVSDEKGKPQSTFIGLPSSTLANSSRTGPVLWNKGPHTNVALRGFSFQGTAVEFVYPKEEAVEIAKVNPEKVPAIDPASEGRPVENKLSDADRQMVTLWTLSAIKIGPPKNSQAAIQAERYKPMPLAVQSAQQTTSPETANAAVQSASSSSPLAIGQTRHASPGKQLASMKRPPVISALPHTASEMPLFLLIGCLAFVLAVGIRTKRKMFS